EVCFPGGKYECEDNSFRNTAVRETCEELGLKPENITICGELDCLVTHNGPIIHPFVGLIDDISKITYSKSEVERIFTVPLKVLLEQKPRRGSVQLADHPGDDFPFDLVPQRKRGWRMNKSYYVYFYLYEDKVIWGLTARMLYAFLYRSRKELTEYLAEEID
ncbi:NUDIX hydrolase, partial [Phascolarctobacterium succinatutens]